MQSKMMKFLNFGCGGPVVWYQTGTITIDFEFCLNQTSHDKNTFVYQFTLRWSAHQKRRQSVHHPHNFLEIRGCPEPGTVQKPLEKQKGEPWNIGT